MGRVNNMKIKREDMFEGREPVKAGFNCPFCNSSNLYKPKPHPSDVVAEYYCSNCDEEFYGFGSMFQPPRYKRKEK